MITKRSTDPVDSSVYLIKLDDTHTAIIDIEDVNRIACYKWELKITKRGAYAFRRKYHKGKTFIIWLHRQIMHTLNGYVVHHLNRNGLDNRKINLLNLLPEQHRNIHSWSLLE